jgi:two-component system chemotaxis sensor kinase CheA
VREVAASLDKPVRFVTEGDDTEADKAVVEALFEPLLHVIRNALDHGVENASVRAAAGKPPIATLTLRAERRGEQVVIEVQDDGAGIDVARVRQVAAERGVATAEALAQLSDAQTIDLIFAAGFSTATEVTSVSGRGVGMDAVRAVIERLGGKVTVDSITARGSTIRFSLPFTVMMTRVMTVEAGGQVFGVPLDAVIETVRTGLDSIAPIGAARAFMLRNRTLPLLDLPQMLGAQQTPPGGDVNIVVVEAAGERMGLQVDRIGEPMDVMLKPMEGLLASAAGIAGTTLLGDGRVLLVLDLNDLV